MSREKIDNYFWNVEKYLMQKYGVDNAARMMYALKWYVLTDRASLDFIRQLLTIKPYVIGRILAKHDNNSIDQTIEALKIRIKK